MSESLQMLRPHEAVPEVDIADEVLALLSLHEAAIPGRLAVIELVRVLMSAVTVAGAAPVVGELRGRIRNPRVGDLVVQTMATKLRCPRDDKITGFGVLRTVRPLVDPQGRRLATFDGEWEQRVDPGTLDLEFHTRAGEVPKPNGLAWYVQYGPDPGDVCRYINSGFLTVPLGHRFGGPVGPTVPGSGPGTVRVTLTAADVVGWLIYCGVDQALTDGLRAGGMAGMDAPL